MFSLPQRTRHSVPHTMEELVAPGNHRVYICRQRTKAWNVDGSSTQRPPFGGSWIGFWKDITNEVDTRGGGERGRCSYDDCSRPANIGGHLWIMRHGVYITPICEECNDVENEARFQTGNSHLREGSVVVAVEYTEDMLNAERRFRL